MKFFLNKFVIGLVFLFAFQLGQAQNYWKAQSDSTYAIDFGQFQSLAINNKETLLPLPDGGFLPFTFENASILPLDLGSKYSILCYTGICALDKKTSATLTLFEGKIYASIRLADKQANIKPTEDSTVYVAQWRAASNDHICDLEESDLSILPTANLRTLAVSAVQKRKNYTIAISCTGEYTAFFGGTKAKALAAIVTTLNRVNTIYNADLGINLILHPNTDKLIFINSSTDPYNNNSAGQIIDIANSTYNSLLGSSTYDLGHTFSTGAGGLAYLGTVCTTLKASAATGTTSPMGDFYDVDFVCHEIGHQFGANHTFNGNNQNCSNNNSLSRFEIGSGSTIMGYAGICDSDNLQAHSDPYFHIQSIKEITSYITNSSGSNCGTFDIGENNKPEILTQTSNGYTIPISTPFFLEGEAKDADGDKLLYNWEQMDLGFQTALNSPTGSSPLFRSFTPNSSEIRYLPKLPNLLSNTVSKGEILPTYTRELNFSFNVRDQKGAVAYGNTNIQVNKQAGPFTVTYPNVNSSFIATQTLTVQWKTANTNLAPINCAQVMILLSLDNGSNFTDTLVYSTPNNGSAQVKLPNKVSSQCRLMVRAADNIFFALNDGKFTIRAPLPSDFTPLLSFDKNTLCTDKDSIQGRLEFETFFANSDSIDFTLTSDNPNFVISIPSGKIDPKEGLVFTIKSTSNAVFESFKVTGEFKSSAKQVVISQELDFYQNIQPSQAQVVFPSNNSNGISLLPKLQWEGDTNSRYEVSIFQSGLKIDSSFSIETKFFTPKILEVSTEYQWQVKSITTCGSSESAIFNFKTGIDTCFSVHADSLPLVLYNEQIDFYSNLFVASKGAINKVSVIDLKGTHEWVSDLDIYLNSPYKQEILLFSQICNEGPGMDFDLNLVDDDSLSLAPCPPVGGGTYKPLVSFEPILGEQSQGIWSIHIKDLYETVDSGIFNNWGIEFCIDMATFSGAPALIRNQNSSIAIGGVVTLETKNLLAWDDLTKTNNISYKLINKSSNLVLVNNKVEVSINQEFSQDDLKAGNIGVQMNDTSKNSFLAFQLINNRGEFSEILYHYFDYNGIILNIDTETEVMDYYVNPNPVQNTLEIHNYENQKISVFNSLGKLLIQKTYSQNLDVSMLISGIYFIQLENGTVLKFEKE